MNNELKNNPFSFPEGYFEELPNAIRSKCEQGKASNRPTTWAVLRPQLAFACGFILLVLVGRTVFSFINSSMSDTPVAAEAKQHSSAIVEAIKPLSDTIELSDEDVIITYLVDSNISEVDIAEAIAMAN